MLAGYDFYQQEFFGSVIPAESYPYYAERAEDMLAMYIPVLADRDAAMRALKKCSCALAESLYSYAKQGAGEAATEGTESPVTSETVTGYYSVSYATATATERQAALNRIIHRYLAPYITRAMQVNI